MQTIATQTTQTPRRAAASPCINVCVMDAASGWCSGCFRTIDEIVGWGASSDAARWAVLDTLAARESAYFGGAQ